MRKYQCPACGQKVFTKDKKLCYHDTAGHKIGTEKLKINGNEKARHLQRIFRRQRASVLSPCPGSGVTSEASPPSSQSS